MAAGLPATQGRFYPTLPSAYDCLHENLLTLFFTLTLTLHRNN